MTPAVLAARRAGVEIAIHEYEHDPKVLSYGEEAAEKLGVDAAAVFKTLVVQSESDELAVAIVPVLMSLDLKSAAAALEVKKLRMADKALVQRSTGYVIGGVSPLGQKKPLRTVVDQSAEGLPQIFISGGKRGLDIALRVEDLLQLCRALLAPIAR